MMMTRTHQQRIVVAILGILFSLVLLNVFLSETLIIIISRVDQHHDQQHHSFWMTPTRIKQKHSDNNQTLVIIIGNLRGGERAWQTLYKNVLDRNKADLALVVGRRDDDDRNSSSLYKRAKYLYEFPEYNDYADAIDTIDNSSTSWRQWLLPLNLDPYGLFGGADNRHGSGAIIFMCRYYVTLFIKEYNLLSKYTRFVITRSDHYYACPYDMSALSNQYIHVPIGEDWKGITDRHLIVPSKYVLKALNMYPPLLHNTSKLVKGGALLHMNPESFIKARWKEEHIWDLVRRHPRTMFTCAVDGDTTRWQRHSHTLEDGYGVYVKYRTEFEAAKCNCGGQHWNETARTCSNNTVR
jgi:hypothetical protein